jgi:hypothetical protein
LDLLRLDQVFIPWHLSRGPWLKVPPICKQ